MILGRAPESSRINPQFIAALRWSSYILLDERMSLHFFTVISCVQSIFLRGYWTPVTLAPMDSAVQMQAIAENKGLEYPPRSLALWNWRFREKLGPTAI